jgi:serine/threonine protein kinase/Tol biopolymer transport system component
VTDALPEIPSHLVRALADRYRIERELGQGGMATVYLAHDVRHDRKVALKVLKPELAVVLGAERFLAEIKTTANLQHPHILPLYDSGRAGQAEGGEFVYYVMPYVEGETLREKLDRERQLPVDEALRIAREVADALDYAHRHGVIHRDIKPENILLHDGRALVADFGIALAVSRSDGGTRMTETGMSLGTPHYMSPEQAMGEKTLTARSDVYALGAVLYEMLVGEPPFAGPTAQAIIARVLTEEPRSLVLQRRTIPPHAEAAVLRAIEKLPADRFATAAEFAGALGDPSFRATPVSTPLAAARRPRAWLARLQLPLVGIAGVALGALLLSLLRTSSPPPVIRYGLALPAAEAPDPEFRAIPSPDGARIVYVGPSDSGPQLWVKERDRYGATPLVGTAGATTFAFSPDGRWIAFVVGRQLKKLPVSGGSAITLADTASSVSLNPGIAWLDDGTIVFTQLGGHALRRVPESGGVSTVVLTDSAYLSFPTGLPGGRGILFTRCTTSCTIEALDLRSGTTHRVLTDVTFAQYVATGHVVYVRGDGGMFAVPFDLRSLQASGPSVPVMDSVSVIDGFYPLMALSSSGTLVMRAGAPLSLLQRYEMVWVDRAGRETPIDSTWTFRLTEFGGNVGWALSPDGTRLAIGLSTDAGDDIWVKQLPRGPLSRVSYDSAAEYRPRWMPGGRSLMFGSNRTGAGSGGLYARPADGTGRDSLILRAASGVFEGAWSPDGRWLLFRTGGTVNQVGGRDIVGIRPGVDSAPVPVVATPYDEEAIALSPDGRWLAYQSDETGRTEVFIRSFPNTNAGKWQVSNGSGLAPLWARNGSELFFVGAHRDMMAVTVRAAGGVLQLGEPRRLFHLPEELYFTSQDFYTPYDVGPDGRFIMARSVTPRSSVQAPLIVVENWFEELKQKVR